MPVSAGEKSSAPNRMPELEPLPDEDPYAYASRLLASSIPLQAPNFVERLKRRSQAGDAVRVLSLCSGAARIEADMATQVGEKIGRFALIK